MTALEEEDWENLKSDEGRNPMFSPCIQKKELIDHLTHQSSIEGGKEKIQVCMGNLAAHIYGRCEP